MGYSTTNGKLYIVELSEPYDRLEIQFVPEEISMPRTAEIVDIAPVGRNHPLHQYVGGDDKLTFTLDFYTDAENRADVITKVRWLMSLCQNDAGLRPQPIVKIIWGDLYQRSKWIVNSVKPRLSMFDGKFGFLPCQALVDITFSLDTKDNIPRSDLRDRTYGNFNR